MSRYFTLIDTVKSMFGRRGHQLTDTDVQQLEKLLNNVYFSGFREGNPMGLSSYGEYEFFTYEKAEQFLLSLSIGATVVQDKGLFYYFVEKMNILREIGEDDSSVVAD